MTETGTFIINGAERVIVSQLVRSPGVYYSQEFDQTGKKIFTATLIPNRGAWLELETEPGDKIRVRIDRTRKMPVTYLLRALGFEDDNQILQLFDFNPIIKNELDRDEPEFKDKEKALEEVYRHIRPNEPTTSTENAMQLIHAMFFDPKRYDLAAVGRFKINKKLGIERLKNKTAAEDIIDPDTGEIICNKGDILSDNILTKIQKNNKIIHIKIIENNQIFNCLCTPNQSQRILALTDIVAAIGYLLNLLQGEGDTDDIDHLGNRRVRSVGELLQNQFRIGLARMERVVKDRMTTQDADIITPQILINIKPVIAAIKEFFGSSQLSQFMDQHNPLSELTHKRRLSALGPGGLSRERAGFEVRDVHNSHYGRMCPIETPEGPNIGLIGSLANFARINQFGFVETPYRFVHNSIVSNEVVYLTADAEEAHIIAQANEPLDTNDAFINERVTARHKQETALFPRDAVTLMDVSPKQVVSIATALIPFLENDDANRALMGAQINFKVYY